jgi:hypothetical protein
LNSAISVSDDVIVINASNFRFSFEYYLREIIQDVLTNQYQQQTIIVNADDGQNLKLLGFIDFLSDQCQHLKIDTKKVVIKSDATDVPTWFTLVDAKKGIFTQSKPYIGTLKSSETNTRFIGCSTGRFSPTRLRLLYELDRAFGNDAYLIAQFAKEEFQSIYKQYNVVEHDNLIEWCKNYIFQRDHNFENLNLGDSIYRWTNSLQSYNHIQHFFHIEVVIETDPFSSWWMTEKIARCLIVGKPFVLFSGQNSIKQLQEWGFTTFESLIDERYDQQPNPALRTKHIIKSLNELYHSSNRLETIGKMYELANKNIEHYNKFINV